MPSVCTADMNDKLSTSAKFHIWYQGYRDTLNTYAQITTDPSPSQETGLATNGTDITGMSLCLQEKIGAMANGATTISTAHEDILNINDQIAEEEANAAVAQERVGYVRHPERQVSSYESWFPMDRPMHKLTLIILISISIFLGVFLFLIMMSVFGVDVFLYVKPSAGSYNRSSYFYQLYSQLTLPFWIALVVLISVILYFAYR
jgi:hypothetical protein